MAEKCKQISASHGTHNSQNDIQENAFAVPVYDLTAEESSN
jgi:hypothetical protein